MEAAELLNTLTNRGITVIAEGSNLRVKGHLTDNMRNMLKVHKVGVLEELSTLAKAEAMAAKYGLTLAEAEAALDTGYPADWADLITRPKSLEAHIRWFIQSGRGVNN